MQAKTIRNKKMRSEFERLELSRYIDTAISRNELIVPQTESPIEVLAFRGGVPGVRGAEATGTEGSKTRIRNLCTLTGRSRAIMGEYKISRIQLKRFGESGKIGGIRKL
jgi:small subunit ribosomal protein S14